jgi:GDP-4-dehydro-6-deoxy-D-mannose reductase
MTAPVQRALVTGAEGFIGRHLVRELERHGTRVTGLARRPGSGSPHIAMGDAPWRAEHLAEIVRGAEPDVVFHLAGCVTGTAAELETLNGGLACSVMEALSLARVQPIFVCCGSATEYGSAIVSGVATPETAACAPLSMYGASKLAQTRSALAFGEATGTRMLVARIFNPIGCGMPPHLALSDFAHQIAALPPSGGVLRTGTLDVARDFIDVELVARALRLLTQHRDANGVVNICSGRATSLAHLVDSLISVSGKPVRLEAAPERVRAGELRSVFGDADLLWRLTGKLQETNYPLVMARIWQDAEARAAGGSQWAA